MTEAKMSMLLAAISAALIHNDRRRAIDLSNAGQTMLNGAESERDAAWREIEKLSNLTSGPSGGGA